MVIFGLKASEMLTVTIPATQDVLAFTRIFLVKKVRENVIVTDEGMGKGITDFQVSHKEERISVVLGSMKVTVVPDFNYKIP